MLTRKTKKRDDDDESRYYCFFLTITIIDRPWGQDTIRPAKRGQTHTRSLSTFLHRFRNDNAVSVTDEDVSLSYFFVVGDACNNYYQAHNNKRQNVSMWQQNYILCIFFFTIDRYRRRWSNVHNNNNNNKKKRKKKKYFQLWDNIRRIYNNNIVVKTM